MGTIGLRYFNVFGPRQDPNGAYAAVIPKWTTAMIEGREIKINGDGETSRDFCYIANAIQANLLAAATQDCNAVNQVYNVAVGDQLSLNELYAEIRGLLAPDHQNLNEAKPKYGPFRAGDVRYSLADVTKARRLLGYEPTHRIAEGLNIAVRWYLDRVRLLSPTVVP